MPIDFPSSPSLNQTYTYSGRTWLWNGTAWQLQSAASVTTDVIADSAVTTAKIAANAVDSSKIASGAVGSTQLGSSSVTSTKIATGAVGSTELASGAVTSTKIAAGAVTGNEIASSVALPGNPTAATQAAGNSSTRLATTAFVGSQIAADVLGGFTASGEVIVDVSTGRAQSLYLRTTTTTQNVLRVQSNVGTTGAAVMTVAANGNVANTNNSYGAISDLKLKENIKDARSQWDDILRIQLRNYNLIAGGARQLGVIAQEVEHVSPGLVTDNPDVDEDGNDLGTITKTVNYSLLYLKAVGALQEAMRRIEALEARLERQGS